MNPLLRKYLESIGLKASASDADAQRYMASLTGIEAEMAAEIAKAFKAFVDEDGDGLCDECGKPEDECTCEVTKGTEDEEKEKEDEKSNGTEAEDEDEEKEDENSEEDDEEKPARALSILGLAKRYGLGLDWAKTQIKSGATLQSAKDAILDKLAKNKRPLQIKVGEDLNRSTIGLACADALLLEPMRRERLKLAEDDGNGNMVERKPHPRAQAFAGKHAVEICRDFLRAHGVPVEGVHRNRIAQMVFDRSVVASHGTSDFPSLLANVLNKSLTRQYQEVTPQWPLFCVKGTAPDFKQVSRVSFGEVPNLTAISEGDEYSEFTIGERKEVYTLTKRGKKFSLTWEAIINDDLSAFLRIPSQMVIAARRAEDALAFGVLTGNAKMGDGVDLFASAHGNIATTTAEKGAPNVARLNSARTAMATQTGISSDVKLNLVPSYILAPWALSGTIDELLNSTANPASNNAGVANIWMGKLTPIYNALLDANSPTKWYLACDPGMIDTIEVAFLAGYESPTLETIDGTSPDKREYFIRHICTAKALDWRGLYYNPGA